MIFFFHRKSNERAITDYTILSYTKGQIEGNFQPFTHTLNRHCTLGPCKATISSGKQGSYQKPLSCRVIARIKYVNKCNQLKTVPERNENSIYISG